MSKHCTQCARPINPDNKSGLCRAHYDASRRPQPTLCKSCDTPLGSANITGLCKTHYLETLPAKVGCSKCGKHILPRSSTGLCIWHHRAALARYSDEQMARAVELRAAGHRSYDIRRHIRTGVALPEIRPEPVARKAVNGARIIGLVSDALNIDRQSIVDGGRWTHFVDARAVVVMAMRARGAAFDRIASAIKRDRSTVIYLHRTFGKRVARQPGLAVLAERVAA